MADSILLNSNQETWLRLQSVTGLMQRARDLELAKIGLTTPQAQVLYHLRLSKEPLTPMKLARKLHKQPHTISALVKRMGSEGLVTANRDMERKNWVRVSLTEKGEKAAERWTSATMLPNVFSSLSKKELVALHLITRKLYNNTLELLGAMRSDPYVDGLFV